MNKTIRRQNTFLKQQPVSDLKQVLAHIERVSFSVFAQAGLRSEHGREPSKASLCSVLEFMTGTLTAETHVFPAFQTFGARVTHAMAEHTRRGNF
eukprot:5688056-Amphidinium_carterae.1